jgi:peptide/nickel transport system permease protein
MTEELNTAQAATPGETEQDASDGMQPARSLWCEARHRIWRDKKAMVCLFIICLYTVIAAVSFIKLPNPSGKPEGPKLGLVPWTFHHLVGPPNKEEGYASPGKTGAQRLEEKEILEDVTKKGVEPSGRHLMGTNIMGVDVLMMTIQGIQTAMILGFLTAALSIPIGLFFGLVSGYFGGRVDDLIVYVYSTLACIPGLLMLIGLMQVLGKGLYQLCFAMGIVGWVSLCRLIRGQTFLLRESEYVLAARAVGASHARIIWRHILPNLTHIIIITFTLGFGGIVMAEAILSYIGMGVGDTAVSWGTMIQQSRMELPRDPSVWWLLTSAAVALMILVLAFNIFGDALRDALDPKLRK